MFHRIMAVGSVLLCAHIAVAQQKSATPAPPGVLQFPVMLQQNVAAGNTPVGTKVKAKLVVATLVSGVVYPKDAVFSGEVIESAAKTATTPSRLSIRMDTVDWKSGSAQTKVYLTAWYYPVRMETGQQNLQYGPTDTSVSWRTWNGAGTYPDANSPASQPFPGRDMGNGQGDPSNIPAAVMSDHPVPLKNMNSKRNEDGSMIITCEKSNIKLDKSTTYILATTELVAGK